MAGTDIGDRYMAGTDIGDRHMAGTDIGDRDMAGTDIGDRLSFWVGTDISRREDELKWCRLLVSSTLKQKAEFEGLEATVISIKVFLDIDRTVW
jgi:hypothetical protein